jgi:hypothetical protein
MKLDYMSIAYGIFVDIKNIGILATEDDLLLFLSGCSAVIIGKDEINISNIIIAPKTYFKLLKTDITKFKSKSVDRGGYLICDKCNQYYHLQPGESQDDFDDNCEFGGHLQYIASLKDN